MNRQLVVFGAIIVIIGSLLPAVTWTDRFQYGSFKFRETVETGSSFFNIAPALIIMFLLLPKWKWRSVITFALALIAGLCTPLMSIWLYSNKDQIIEAVVGERFIGGGSTTNLALSYGIIVVAVGYLIVTIGSIREINVQRRPKAEA